MCFPPFSGHLLRLSSLFLKICRWITVAMSSSSRRLSSGKLPTNYKISKKSKEPSAVPNCTRKWRRKLFYLWLLLIASIGVGWSSMSYRDINNFLAGKCEFGKELEHFNVSNSEIHALASLFAEYEQVASIRCTRETALGNPSSNGYGCAIEVFCSEKGRHLKQHILVTTDPGLLDQCPVQNKGVTKTYDVSKLEDRLRSLISLCESSSPPGNFCISKEISQARGREKDGACETSSLCLAKKCWWIVAAILIICKLPLHYCLKQQRPENPNRVQSEPVAADLILQQRQHQILSPPKGAGKWQKKLLIMSVLCGVTTSIWLYWDLSEKIILRREETLSNMCDERARMLQDQFNVSMNHVHALAILVSTFHHGKHPSAIDQKTFGEYTERTAFERPLTSGVAYALKVVHSEREQFEKEHGWTIRKMEFEDQTLVQDCSPGSLDPAPEHDEYAPVIFSQETVSHIVSIDMMSGKEDRENILRARASGKGVLTSPFKLLKSNHLGVVLTFAVYNKHLPPDASPEQRAEATVGYLGASYDVPSLVEKLLHQLASKQKIVVNVYDTTNKSAPINMYGNDVVDTGLVHISNLDFGDPQRNHEMHCRFKHKPTLPWTAINSSVGVLVITLLVGHIFHAAINRIAKVEEDYREMMELKSRAEAADVAKSQFLATVSHEIRTPMNGVLGMLQMLMDTELDAKQMDYAQTAHASGKDLISIINEVLDQAKIESGRLELESVPFDPRAVLDNVLSLFSGRSNEKQIELAVYVSNKVPEIVIGDPVRFRQIITNLVGNSIKFTTEGHIFVSVHLVDEVQGQPDVSDKILSHDFSIIKDASCRNFDTLSGFPVVERQKSWEKFKKFSGSDEDESVEVLVTVEDTGIGIPFDAQSRIFTPFMQADSSTSRTYGGTGIGLSISKCLVDLMRGEIGFVSEPSRGSTFSLTVPLARCRGNRLEVKLQNHEPVVTDLHGLRALVIDKRGVRAEVTRYHLCRLGISVDTASNFQVACSASGSLDYAMVLIHKDVWDTEDHSGLVRLITNHRQGNSKVDLPKIFLLATSINPSERRELKSAGFIDNILMMPLRLSVLVACFQEALGNGTRKRGYQKKQPTLGSLLREKRILVVDDNIVNRRVAEGALTKYGAIVTCVDSGKAAVERLHPPHGFHACFMDLQMPGMDGLEATRRIRSIEKEFNEKIASDVEEKIDRSCNVGHWRTPILAMTADVIQASNGECAKCGMDDYVAKPFEEEQLYSAVARFFESG